MAIRRIGLVVNHGKSEATAAARVVRAWAGEHGVCCQEVEGCDDFNASSEMTGRPPSRQRQRTGSDRDDRR
jgi:hypothetical protein